MPLVPPTIILVEPQFVGNAGAIARAMANFSYDKLIVVGGFPKHEFDHEINKEISNLDWALSTERGQRILDQSKECSTLEEAIHGMHFVLGASGKTEEYHGGYQRDFLSPVDSKKIISQKASKIDGFKWALVFGREDDGLPAKDAGMCDCLVKVPTNPQAPSMNLAVAAAVLMYEFSSLEDLNIEGSKQKTHSDKRDAVAPVEEVEVLVGFVINALKKTQFFKHPDAESAKGRLRKILRQSRLNRGDLLLFLEIFYQLKCWGQNHFEERSFFSVGKKKK